MSKATKREVKVVLTFTESNLNDILKAAWVSKGKAPKVKDMTDEQFAVFAEEVSDVDFVGEFINATEEQTVGGGDWLEVFLEQFKKS